jgi:transcriptional regulator with XRE-family HTH domain
MSQWPIIVKQLMAEQKISERQLCIRSGVWRNSLRTFLHVDGRTTIDRLERILFALDCELVAISHPDGDRTCQRSDQEFADAVKSWRPVRDAVAKNYVTENARRATTQRARRLVNAVTTANGNKPAKPSSPSIGDA